MPLNNLKFLLISALSICFMVNGYAQERKIAIVLHAGAGYMRPDMYTKEQVQDYTDKLSEARDAGYMILESGGTSEDATVATIKILENSTLFNAGIGCVLSHDKRAEMDASIMNGADRNAGAVAGVQRVKNPITAAQAVMHNSKHVMLSGKGADDFATEQGLEMVDPSYFITDERMRQIKKIIEEEKDKTGIYPNSQEGFSDNKFGTVGVVALDKEGNICAATSTGGMMNKKNNRIGDSPVIGAGTYADNRSCGVSCTGHGEYFIRLAVAHEVSALMLYRGWDLEKATNYVVHKELIDIGGAGGLIAVDRKGNISMSFNTPGMFRAAKSSSGENSVAIFSE
jgi:L-asparaginase / beta-aspartyl-peptidase